ncbi:cytochrome c3 family protein [Aquabacterium humicola]|uniref:cytochrome c3 family protein n=1 Tax=Aquabacterium humicola TaxID=3237377 RepID=UPI00254360B3|nr:cytochrome c3 family protein [Rubrivivax pictus]
MTGRRHRLGAGAPPGSGRRARLWLGLLLLVLAVLAAATAARGQAGTSGFDHLRTGFALSGQHAQARCEACHQDGILQGTPRDCAACHRAGQRFARGNVVMPANHLPTTLACDSCHGTKSFAGARFNHAAAANGGCATCHNGSAAPGKPANHVATRASCDSCHRSGAWLPLVAFDHAGVAPGSCASCHNGSRATARPAQHVPTGAAACDDCHRSYAQWRPTAWNHTQLPVAGQCAGCHSGGYPPADGKPANHVPYQSVAAIAGADCGACHKAGYASWSGARVHAGVALSGGCATCHGGGVANAAAKPADTIHANVSGTCERCHQSTTSWAGAKVDHAVFDASTACARCHDGAAAAGKPATHMPAGAATCGACHATTGWKPSTWNHTQFAVAAQCASCHSGGFPPADGRPARHIPNQSVAATASANCDACHKGSTTSWANGRLHANFTVATGCAACHDGTRLAATAKPSNAVHANVSGNCESCHKSTGTWAGTKVDHAGFSAGTACASCHDGTAAAGKAATHVPVGSANCASCHTTTGWLPSKWNHTQATVTAQCSACHTGGYAPADGRPANHIPYQNIAAAASANCDACHKGSFTTWANGKFHAYYGVSAGCAACHGGNYLNAVGKPSTPIHASVTGNCESCHKSTTTWAGAKVDHTGFNDATNCASCHNGSSATGKSGTHIPAGSTNCFACHGTGGWAPSKWNHTQTAVAAQCASCHSGGYPPADGRPANHIPYQTVAVSSSANCDGCHKGSTSTWANGKFHAYYGASSNCASCHTGNYLSAVGKPSTPIHASVTGNCESCHKSTTTWSGAKVDHASFNDATNCASCHNGSSATGKSSSHIPVGSTNCFACHGTSGWTPSKWNHTQTAVAAQCASCHSGGYPPADGRPANHIPYQTVSVSSSANCDGCHKGSTTTWANGKFHAYYGVSSGCASCHTGNYLNAVGKPSTPIHAGVTGNCESCHKSTTTWSGAKVDHAGFNDATNCASCHNGSSATGKSSSHIPAGSTNCFACHGTSGWTPSKWNHTQTAVAAQCASCHSGGYPPADGRPANHIPYQTVSVSSSANCDGCHKGSTTTWANGKFHAYYGVSSGCASCHTGNYLNAVGKPSTPIHAGVTGNCESCHKSTTTWAGAKVDHSGFNGATNCASCHNGSSATGKSGTHIPVGATNCFACHGTTSWIPSKWNHTQTAVAAQCASCHSGGYPPADGRPANHIPYQTVAVSSSANCDACHKGSTTTWANGKFHAYYGVSSGCAACHTGNYLNAVGKPSTPIHASVTGNCESCHKSTTTWGGAKVDHTGFNDATNCASCHNGSSATGKSGTHIPAGSTSCFTCHGTSGWVPSKRNHTQTAVAAQCASCHTGGYPPADGRPGNHIPYQTVAVSSSANCDACHKGSTTTWANGKFHAYYSVSTGCASCHTGSYLNAVGKPATAVHASVTGNCESCHKSTTTWAGAKVDHSGFTAATICANCHNGSSATGKPGTHIPVGATNCFACHGTTSWIPSKWNHTQTLVAAQCASCHTGGYPPADGRPGNHIPYQTVAVSSSANCDACHKGSTTTWANGKFHASYSVSTGCFSCHTGSYLNAVGKPATSVHATVTGNCESCHKSTTTWAGAKVDHTGFNDATICANCHNGSSATGKPGTHIPVGATNCFACHGTTAWVPSKWNHTQVLVAAQCASCHTGGYPPADGRPGNHIPYQTVAVSAAANCDACHKGSTTTWANGKFHASYSVSTGCFSCHTGSYLNAVGKPPTPLHATVTGNCESCHKSTASWANVSFAHSPSNAVGTGTCDTCHNGSTAKGKPATHLPIPSGIARCDSCHKSQASWTTSVTMNHSVVTTGLCKSCHNGSYTGSNALAKPANHIPEVQLLNGAGMDCNACHSSTTSWGTQKMNHNGSLGNGAGWCKACHQSGTSYAGGMERKSLTHEKSTGVTDCSQSGCHRPLGTKGSPYTKWD